MNFLINNLSLCRVFIVPFESEGSFVCKPFRVFIDFLSQKIALLLRKCINMKFHYNNFFVLAGSTCICCLRFSRMLCVLDHEISELMIYFNWMGSKVKFSTMGMLLLPIAILSSGSFLVLQCVLAFATDMFIHFKGFLLLEDYYLRTKH